MKPLRVIAKIAFLAFFLAAVPVLTSLPFGLSVTSVAKAAVVNRIEVRGNLRMDSDTVISYLTISSGESFSKFDIDASVKALFATGLFSDVSIYQDGSVLVVEVDENSTVNKVFFEGNTRLKDESLAIGVQLKPQTIYSEEKAASDVERISIAYGRVGRDDADISYEVVPLENNRVNVIYRINEGNKTKIRQIIFVGNQTFSDRRLHEVITTSESNLLSFLTTNDIYDPNRVDADQELLRSYYFNKGFADFQVLSVDADLDEAENEYVITFTMEEGPRYTFGEISVESTISGVSSDSLLPLLETVSGDYYSARLVESSIVAITRRVAEEGYAFVETVPRGNRNFDNNTIDVAYLVDEGARIYIEDIKIVGNDRTRDYVIRRAFELSEGDAYNKVLIQKTRGRIQALGFFTSVDITTRPGSEPDKVILIVRVIEQSTGEFSISGGYSSNGGASAEVSFSERNFLGRGQFIRVRAQQSVDERTYGFTFTEPYFLGYRMTAGFDISTTASDNTNQQRYTVNSTAGTVSFGIPIVEKLSSRVFYTIRTSDTSVATSLLDPAVMPPAVPVPPLDGVQGNVVGELSAALTPVIGGWLASGFGYSLTYNKLDNFQNPRDGYYAKFSQTFFGAGGDARYSSMDATLLAYKTLSEDDDIILLGRARGGHIEVFDVNGFRTIDNFRSNIRSVRGFDSIGFGPRDPITGDALGGKTYWNATAEVQFPLPFIPKSFGLRGAIFADAGMLFNLSQTAQNLVIAANVATVNPDGGLGLNSAQRNQLDDRSTRASIGASVVWASPFGPLRIDYAVPIASESYDDLREFNFGVSSQF